MEIPLPDEFRALDLRAYLSILWPERSQRALDSLFRAGRIRSHGRVLNGGTPLEEVRELTLEGTLDGVEEIPWRPSPEDEALGNPEPELVWEDSRLLALSKPAGIPVVPDRTRARTSCLGFLIRRELRARDSKPPREFVRFRVVHRIDRWTSGLVLFAKTPEAERALASDFEHRRVEKEYYALLSGLVPAARIAVHCPVVSGRKGRMRAELEGAPDARPWKGDALTEFDVLERVGECTLVLARPRSGRTHQIRVHAWAMGHPLIADPLYGPKGPRPAWLPGDFLLALHAFRVTLGDAWEPPRRFECPLPPSFRLAIEAARGSGVA